MVFELVWKGLRTGKARFLCAVAGVAVATGAVTFMSSLVATNRAQAPRLAERACAPWAAWSVEGLRLGRGRGGGAAEIPGRRSPSADLRHRADMRHRADLRLRAVAATVDYRPGGRVLQGPPMRALVAEAPAANPYAALTLAEGRWPDLGAGAAPEVVCVRPAMRRFGRGEAPPVGKPLKFVGREGTMTAMVVGYLDGTRLPAQFPTVFANAAAFGAFAPGERGAVSFYSSVPDGAGGDLLTARSEAVVAGFRGDEQRRMDYATPLLLVASALTALALLVNTLLLSVEANRMTLATLRTVGLTRTGVVAFVACESLVEGAVGWLVGAAAACGALVLYVAADAAAFPVGVAFDLRALAVSAAVLPIVSAVAVAFALRPALAVRGMDAAASRPRPRRHGMAVTFALGFAAFAAVEVWGASLMRAFIPSPEWPDAIVSLLPGGVSSFAVEKLRTVEGVKRISELVPRQYALAPECAVRGGHPGSDNALFLAAEFLPRFAFAEGDWQTAERAMREGESVVITRMMANACGLHAGDALAVTVPGRRGGAATVRKFPIAGVVDLNWHMVTSRGLVRGLNGASPMTTGPVFCSLDTMGTLDPRTYMTDPSVSAPMTHLWVEYEPDFLARHGVFGAGRLIEAEIARLLGNPREATVRLHARDEIADGTLAHGSDVIGQAARVPFVFLAILAIGFVAMLVAEADARRREFAVLRAVGATRAQLAAKLAASAAKTAAWGVLAGLPVGALAGWLCTFGTGNWPGLPHAFVVPARVVAEGAAGALAFALAVAVPTALALVGRRRESLVSLKS